MRSSTFAVATLALTLTACGALDPGAQQRLLYGPMAAPAVRQDVAEATKQEAAKAICQRAVAERDPNLAAQLLAVCREMLQ